MKKPFATAAVVVLGLVAILHLARVVLGWKVIVGTEVMALGGTPIPMWASYLAVVIAGGLAVMLWRESR
jgi:TRAP-type C4-dicarboxylate transport system permease small subunit